MLSWPSRAADHQPRILLVRSGSRLRAPRRNHGRDPVEATLFAYLLASPPGSSLAWGPGRRNIFYWRLSPCRPSYLWAFLTLSPIPAAETSYSLEEARGSEDCTPGVLRAGASVLTGDSAAFGAGDQRAHTSVLCFLGSRTSRIFSLNCPDNT